MLSLGELNELGSWSLEISLPKNPRRRSSCRKTGMSRTEVGAVPTEAITNGSGLKPWRGWLLSSGFANCTSFNRALRGSGISCRISILIPAAQDAEQAS